MYQEWEKAAQWIDAGHRIVLASVIKTWGSSPRPPGSVLAIREDGLFEGSVSGGCIEGAVILEAAACLKSSQPKILEFKANPEDVWAPGLSCGGHITIFVNPVPNEALEQLGQIQKNIEKHIPSVLVTSLKDGKSHLLSAAGTGPKWLSPAIRQEAEICLRKRTPALVTAKGVNYFINVISPQPKLYIFGAVHIAQTLAPIAKMTGFEVFIIDPREAFADPDRFPGQDIIVEWPDRFLEGVSLSASCAIVTLTHDPKLDQPVLSAALNSDCFYIGALGSQKTQATRAKNLKKLGFSDRQLKRISGPVGLAIGAKTPEEIAVSILAELIQAIRGH